jgi:alanine racemase
MSGFCITAPCREAIDLRAAQHPTGLAILRGMVGDEIEQQINFVRTLKTMQEVQQYEDLLQFQGSGYKLQNMWIHMADAPPRGWVVDRCRG